MSRLLNIIPGVLFALLLLSACLGEAPLADEQIEAPPYEPAETDFGQVIEVWIHEQGERFVAEPGTILVAADLFLPEPEEGRFDLDDIDIFDADTGENFGSDPYIERLTLDGELIAQDDPAVADQREYRGIFVWQVPETVKRVNFGYWGEMLYRQPVPIGTSDRPIPEQDVAVESFAHSGPAAPGYEEYHLILQARHWYRIETPEYQTLTTSDQSVAENRFCSWERWIEIDENDLPLDTLLLERPYQIESRRFLMTFWCPTTLQPDLLNRYGTTTPLPADPPDDLPAETMKRLAIAEQNPYAYHRTE